ncbi:EF-hand domain-containing protein [Nocardiopsis composta]|uniref:Ca2+-binding EF-hand superfamily protein n=1 Tax=Nocardiopsis composta TaxID=157465 RepID=A0A7W8QHE0_9ACTN|nr:EF-hand domain-containing protein [Nocardiopsis composta]MBB5430264.1 Ca2+-binding EF-hand superfamily protein [Nocardiopsis composta]
MPESSEYAASFALVDADGDGRISAEELAELMGSSGDPAARERAEALISLMDADGDRLITLEEYTRFMNERS